MSVDFLYSFNVVQSLQLLGKAYDLSTILLLNTYFLVYSPLLLLQKYLLCSLLPASSNSKSISSRRRSSGCSVIDDIDFPMAILAYFFFSSLSSVKTTSLPHMPNDLFDQIWRKGVPFGSLVQKFSAPTLQAPKI